jgi:hypothetical protein
VVPALWWTFSGPVSRSCPALPCAPTTLLFMAPAAANLRAPAHQTGGSLHLCVAKGGKPCSALSQVRHGAAGRGSGVGVCKRACQRDRSLDPALFLRIDPSTLKIEVPRDLVDREIALFSGSYARCRARMNCSASRGQARTVELF